MIKVYFDGAEHEVPEGLTVLQAAQRVGIDIPHYCYHPGLSIDGNCRMCLVEIDKSSKPAISCNTRVAEGMAVRTRTEAVEKMRKAVMEFLLLNHPLDCPECDQAGECRLQDYYMQHDMQASRLGDIERVHKPKMVDLGPNVVLDAERCILCTRCVRFCNEISKTGELYIKNRGAHSEITTFPGKPLDNAYATCTVDVCPVGALTSKDFRFKKRVWFLQHTASICNGCATGCNVSIDHADGKVYRYRPRYNPDVNRYWMCDEGRLSYKGLQGGRINAPLARTQGHPEGLAIESLEAAHKRVAQVLGDRADGEVAFVVSAQQSNEGLAAVARFREAFFPNAAFYYSQKTVPDPSSDGFLIKADKNPNTKGVEALAGCRPIAEWREGPRVVLAFDHLNEFEAEALARCGLDALIAFTAFDDALARAANLVLPVPIYWEESGSFTNASGRVQPFSACFEAPEGVLSAQAHLDRLRALLMPARAVA